MGSLQCLPGCLVPGLSCPSCLPWGRWEHGSVLPLALKGLSLPLAHSAWARHCVLLYGTSAWPHFTDEAVEGVEMGQAKERQKNPVLPHLFTLPISVLSGEWCPYGERQSLGLNGDVTVSEAPGVLL